VAWAQQCLEASAPVLEPEGDMEVMDGGQVGADRRGWMGGNVVLGLSVPVAEGQDFKNLEDRCY
jgi:hypothetical protein